MSQNSTRKFLKAGARSDIIKLIMAIFTIPKNLVKQGELVVIPKKEYEELLRRRVIPTATLSSAEKRALARGRKEIASGEYISLDKLEHELGLTRRKKR